MVKYPLAIAIFPEGGSELMMAETTTCKHRRTRALYQQRRTVKGRRFIRSASQCRDCGHVMSGSKKGEC